MSKTRIYQLAKDLGVSSKEMIEKLKEFDIEVANHMSALDDDEAELITEFYSGGDKAEEAVTEEDEEDFDDDSEESQAARDRLKIDLQAIEDEEFEKKERNIKKSKSKKKRKQKRGKYKQEHQAAEKAEAESGVIRVGDTIMVSDLAEKLGKQANQLIVKLMQLGVMAAVNEEIDFETAELLATDFGLEIEKEKAIDDVDLFNLDQDDPVESLKKRAPVVTVMGHVDHGKTSLLDAIRSSKVADAEAGGITQHIGASEVVHNGEKIVFLDTPGHEAFTTLRARGAKVTDIAILVVAADDGVMPQTIEAIDHAKAAGVPIIVAINKIDKNNANPDRVKQELSERGILIEEWGGDVISVPVSALKREGIDELLENVLLVAEMQELKANPDRPAVGTIIEAKVEKGRGTVTSVLIEKGQMKIGDSVIAGTTYGRIRAMHNHVGKQIKEVGPASAVEIMGLNEIPQAGDKLYVVSDDRLARTIAEKRAADMRQNNLSETKHISLEDLFAQIQTGEVQDLNIIIKADVHGSVEALRGSLLKLSNEEVKVNIIHANVGTVTESDILLASASNAIIIGFNVRPATAVKNMAEREAVELKTYRIIYNAIDDIEKAMTGMLAPEYKEVVLGHIEVRDTFKVPNVGVIAGGYVKEGKVVRNAQIRLAREGIVVHEGKIASLRRFKDDVKEVATGYECGISIENYNDIKEGDIIEAFIIEEIPRG